MNYLQIKAGLERGETPRIHSGDTVTIEPIADTGAIDKGDVVFCKVNGHFYFHLVKAKRFNKRQNRWSFLIGNNHGHDNGWSSMIFGKVLA